MQMQSDQVIQGLNTHYEEMHCDELYTFSALKELIFL